jgi:preprotein translocase subunit YajC
MMLTTLRKGDKVVTNSGMFGTIVGMDDKENKVVLKVAENVKIEFLKSSIAGRVGAEE